MPTSSPALAEESTMPPISPLAQQVPSPLSLVRRGQTQTKQKLPQKLQRMVPLAVFVGVILLGALPALACGGVEPGNLFLNGLMHLPLFTTISSFGVLPLVIIPLESWILHRREEITVRRSLRIVILANGLYALLLLFSATFGSIPFPFIGGIFSAALATRFIQPVGMLKNLGRAGFVALLYGSFALIDMVGLAIRLELRTVSSSSVGMFAFASAALLIGFIFSFVVKGYALKLAIRDDRASLAGTAFSMQVVVFLVTAIVALALVPFNRGPLLGIL